MNTSSSLEPFPPIEQSPALQRRLEATRKSLGYQTAYFRETFSDELWQAMEHRGLTQAEFAEKANVPKQFLTKVFKGGNCTSDTIVKLAHALNYKAHVHLTPNDIECEWIHCVPQNVFKYQSQLQSYVHYWVGAEYKEVTNVEKEVKCATLTARA